MTFEASLLRRIVGRRAEKQRPRGRREEVDPAVRPMDGLDRPQRDEARFIDQTGATLADMNLALPPTGDFSDAGNSQFVPTLF